MKQIQLTVDDVRNRFKAQLNGAEGNVYAAPGRINLIGEHAVRSDISVSRRR